ncbi:MAG: LacI family DNA-binding transcriptional regulator [Propioniciclava sp.]|uniref:LacI family DNA-binding transcriptional regulator n=1 Tax=Propioniciclava sp. TaxID=2038686 RepID=UPI0039E6A596
MRRKSGSRVTLADVAERSGMSKSAVSMILNNKPGSRLSAEAIERVRAAASELDYRPNPVAQSLRSGKTRAIGLISDQVTITRYATNMIVGALNATREHRHTVFMAETGSEPDALGEAISAMLDRRVDGIAVALMGARMVDVPEVPTDTPLVIINGTTSDDHPSILPDEAGAGRAVAQSILDAGHRHIGVLGELDATITVDPRRTVTIGSRFRAINETLAAAGVEPACAPMELWSPPTGYETTLRLMAERPGLTALIAANDNVAFGIYQALTELGLRIPEDVSVISFDDEEVAAYHRPGLTTARLPYEEMGRLGAEMLLGAQELRHAVLPMPLIWRGSVRDLSAN